MNCIRHRPSPSGALSYYALDELMRNSRNPDFYSGIPIHAAGNVMKSVCEAMKSFFKQSKRITRTTQRSAEGPDCRVTARKADCAFSPVPTRNVTCLKAMES